MNKLYTIIFVFIFSISANAQPEETDILVLDLLTLADKYVTPAADASVYQSAASWFSSAKKKELWEIDIAVHGNMLFIPKKQRTVRVSNSDFNILSFQSGVESDLIPTALGNDEAIFFEGTAFGDDFELQTPEGINDEKVYNFFIQGNIGLWYGSELIVRYAPKIDLSGSKFGSLGFGLKHNISQHFSSLKDSKTQIAGLISYALFDVDLHFSDVDLIATTVSATQISSKSLLFQALASHEIGKFEILGAFGYTSSTFDYELEGAQNPFLTVLNGALTNLSETRHNFKADLGFNVKIWELQLNSLVSLGKFTNINLGIQYKI